MNVSVIIPIYNTNEHKLRKCIESVLKQTYQDFELILVNDGSTNNVKEVINSYNDKRLLFLSKSNGGVGSARNFGLNAAKGEWVVFIDSDDYVHPEHLELLISNATVGCDMIVCGYQAVFTNSIKTHQYQYKEYLGPEGLKRLFTSTDFIGHQAPWDKAFRRSIIQENKLFFNEKLPISEDRLFIYTFLLFARGVVTTTAITYHHDASDASSLSGHYPSTETQVKRYRLLSAASQKLVTHFKLSKKESEVFNKYNLTMLDLLFHLPCSFPQKINYSVIASITDFPLLFKYVWKKCIDKD